jgi:hypothetical protein
MGTATGERGTSRAKSAAATLALCLLLLIWSAPSVRAAPPTLTILSPADGAIIGNGTPVSVVFVVSDFNLTEPGSGVGSANEGHAEVFVDSTLFTTTSKSTVDLSLPSGRHDIRLRLVSDNGTGLSPDVSASIAVTVTHGPAVGTPRIQVSFVDVMYPIPGVVLNDNDVTVSFRIWNFTLVAPESREPVPNEGHVAVFLDGVYNRAVMAFGPVAFSDLEDGPHTVTLQLVDHAGAPLTTPDASASVTFRIEGTAIPDINPYLSAVQIILAFAILGVLFIRYRGPRVLERFFDRMRGRKA